MKRQWQWSLILFAAVAFAAPQVNIVTGPVNSGLTVTCNPGSELIGVLGTYSQTCQAAGGSGVYSWAVSGLPRNFRQTQDTGSASFTITGIPYHAATNTVLVTAMDSGHPPLMGTAVITLVARPGITDSSN